MTKSERLMFLVNLLKNRRVMSVGQLSAECEVTSRTIYRDMISLSRMSIPIYYDRGYRLAGDSGVPPLEFTIEDIELLCYCLRFNPAAENPFFSRKFRLIERKLREKLRASTGSAHTGLCLMQESFRPRRSGDDELLGRFLRALVESCMISIATKDTSEARTYCPIAVFLRGNATHLVVAADFHAPAEEIRISQVRSLRLINDPMDRQDLESYRKQWWDRRRRITSGKESEVKT